MRKSILTLLITTLLPIASYAQDDVYFTPSKEDVRKAKTIRSTTPGGLKKNMPSSEVAYAGSTYYGGISKTDDEYNRRVKRVLATASNMADSVQSIADSLNAGIVRFTPTNGVVKSEKPDTVYKYILVDEEDAYSYCRRMSRFDDFYFASRFYGPYWGIHPFWGPLYDPWFDPWYDPWFDPWYRPWSHNWWYVWHDPWYPGYFPYYPGGYFPVGPIVVYNNPGAKYGYTGSHNHTLGNRTNGNGFAHRRGTTNASKSYAVANRNGGSTNRMTGRGGTYRGANRAEAYRNGTYNERSNDYRQSSYSNRTSSSSQSSFSSGGGGGGFSGGGHSGGGFGSHSGGGHFGGGGRR